MGPACGRRVNGLRIRTVTGAERNEARKEGDRHARVVTVSFFKVGRTNGTKPSSAGGHRQKCGDQAEHRNAAGRQA